MSVSWKEKNSAGAAIAPRSPAGTKTKQGILPRSGPLCHQPGRLTDRPDFALLTRARTLIAQTIVSRAAAGAGWTSNRSYIPASRRAAASGWSLSGVATRHSPISAAPAV